jgi:ABC-2 type transport system permease protein
MNALDESMVPAARPSQVAPVHKTHRFKLLLQREFWEHKGGFFWAPLVAGGIFLVLALMGIVVGEVAANRLTGDAGQISLEDGGSMSIKGLDLGRLTEKLGPEELKHLSGGVDLSLMMASSWPFIVLAFVVFFYCLGALYDERKDRSVLFWKSLPLSDRDTVLSKVASATLVAPALAVIASIITMFGFLLVASVVVMLHGGNAYTLLWGPGSPLLVAGQFIAAIPVYALWALPTVGWLLLCSAWARSKPFLWAIMIPVFAGIFVTWFDIMQAFDLDTVWFWKNVVARALFSVAPGSWMEVANFENANIDGPGAIRALFNLRSVYSVLLTPQLWVGAAAGAAMIAGAVRLRRWRDEG